MHKVIELIDICKSIDERHNNKHAYVPQNIRLSTT